MGQARGHLLGAKASAHRYALSVAWALIPSGILIYVALYSVVPMLPGLERLFGTAPGTTHLGIGLPFLVLVLLSPVVPRIRLPVGTVIGGGLFGVGLFGVLAGLAPNLEIWTLCRTLQGAFAAAVPGLSLALIPKVFPGKHAQVAGFWVAGNVLGGGLGRGLGGFWPRGWASAGPSCCWHCR